jgi:hypothetical protein
MPNVRKCKNCFYWDPQSSKYGKCSKLGRLVDLRFAYTEGDGVGVVFAMTPRWGLCNDHLFKHEAKLKIEN